MTSIAIAALTLDAELQPRAAIDRGVLENYVQLLVDGVRFPPVVVFRDDGTLWLADGFHRWHAHNVIEVETIDAEIIDGSRREALLYSLSANAKHGLQRGATDYRRAYEIACRNGLVDATDSEAVAGLLHCSGSWADRLTAGAREAARTQRDAEIIRLKDQGKGSREIGRETGVPETTVRRVTAPKEDSADLAQSDPPPWVQKLRDLNSPSADSWAAALRALRLINEQPPVEYLFEARFHRFDHVFGPELEKAFAWITELHGRFADERQSEPRRA